MSVLFSDFTSILFLFNIILRAFSSIVLNIDDEKQPLVCEISQEHEYFSTTDPTWSSDHPQNIQFFSHNRLITACPVKDENPDTPYMLEENANDETTCEDSSISQPVAISLTDDFKCGGSDEGLWHAVGYLVQLSNFFLNEKLHFGAIYHICYSKSEGVLYTLHTIFNGNRVKPFEDWKEVNTGSKITSDLKLMNRKHDDENKYEIQLVPFDDMIPMPWKYTTLFDFNFISANARVKAALDELDRSIRSYTDRTSQAMRIFSGIKIIEKSANKDGIVWYWRIVENGSLEIVFMVANRAPKLDEISCKRVPHNENFILSAKEVTGLLCCESGESIKNYLNVTLPSVSNVPQYKRS